MTVSFQIEGRWSFPSPDPLQRDFHSFGKKLLTDVKCHLWNGSAGTPSVPFCTCIRHTEDSSLLNTGKEASDYFTRSPVRAKPGPLHAEVNII